MGRELPRRAAPPAVYNAVKDRLDAAERLVSEQRATIARLGQAVHAAERRAELAEQAAKAAIGRAYGFAVLGAGGRR